MKISFFVECVTSLRYFFPITRILIDLGHDVSMYYPTEGPGISKYNSSLRNLQVFALRVDRLFKGVKLIPVSSNVEKIKTDVLFTLECVPRGCYGHFFEYKQRFCIQHGTDYTNFVQYTDDKTTYIAHDEYYCKDLIENFNVKAVYPEKPVTFWDIDLQLKLINFSIETDKAVYIFYPDRGHQETARKIINHLHDKGYTIIVKQRRKHQNVENFKLDNVSVVYDDIWYPSEAVALPAISNFCIGFSSAAYTDLIPTGIDYVDLALEPYSRCRSEVEDSSQWLGYVKPKNSNNFYYINSDNYDEIESVLSHLIEKNSKNTERNRFDNFYNIGKKFLTSIL